jgi:hypothetical protein
MLIHTKPWLVLNKKHISLFLSKTSFKFVPDFRGALIYGLRLYPLNLNSVMVAKEKAEQNTFRRIAFMGYLQNISS